MASQISNPIPSAARMASSELQFPFALASVCGFGLLGWTWAAFVRMRGLPKGESAGILLAAIVTIAIAAVALHSTWPQLTAMQRAGYRAGLHSILLLALFIPEYLARRPVTLPRSVLLALILAGLFLALYMAAARTSIFSISEGMAKRLAGCIAAGFLAVTSAMSLWKLHVFGYVGQDIGYFMQCFYTALHGQLFHSNMYHDLLYSQRVTSDFAAHNQIVLFFFLPFYALHPSAETMLMVRNVMVAACAWPAFLIANKYLSPLAAVIATLGFLLTPAICYQNLYDFAPLSLAGFPLLFALYYYLEERFVPFALWLFATQCVREDLVFVTFGCGVLALLSRRSWRWSAFPLLFSVLWAFLSWKVMFPHYLHGATSVVQGCFSYLGSSPRTMIGAMAHHPGLWINRDTVTYVKQLIAPVWLVAPLLSPISLLAAPFVAINMLGQDGGCNTAMVYRHYSMIPSVLLFVAVIVSIPRLSMKIRTWFGSVERGKEAAALFLLAAAAASLTFVTGAAQVGDVHSHPWHEDARTVARMIPNDASVAVPRYMLPLMANRMELYQSLRLLEYHDARPQYIVVDEDWARQQATAQWRPEFDRLQHFLATASAYSRMYENGGYVIYKLCQGCDVNFPAEGPSEGTGE